MKTWVEISQKNLFHNLKEFDRHLQRDVRFMAVVKSNAYGHDLTLGAKIIASFKFKNRDLWFGVDSVSEGIDLRNFGVKQPILVLGYAPLEDLEKAIKHDLRLTIYNRETALKLSHWAKKFKKSVKVHIKLDTGLSRQGVGEKQIAAFASFVKTLPGIILEGLSTHYANIEDTTEHSYASKQLESFLKAKKILEKLGINIPISHTACSAAAILFPHTHFNMVRVGISLYGLWSSLETAASAKKNKRDISLKPVLAWKTMVAQIKRIPGGTPVSYGLSERVRRKSKIAVLPVGYFDGYARGLSSKGEVLIGGKRCKILGRVCMNMMMADITACGKVRLEDEVVLLGSQNNLTVTAQELAQKLQTINYEIITRINPFIKRIIV